MSSCSPQVPRTRFSSDRYRYFSRILQQLLSTAGRAAQGHDWHCQMHAGMAFWNITGGSISTWGTTQRKRGLRATRRRTSSRQSLTLSMRCLSGVVPHLQPESWTLVAASGGHPGIWQQDSAVHECKVGRFLEPLHVIRIHLWTVV